MQLGGAILNWHNHDTGHACQSLSSEEITPRRHRDMLVSMVAATMVNSFQSSIEILVEI